MRIFLFLIYQFSFWNLLGYHVAEAQTPRSVTLRWSDAANLTGTTYTIYRATGTCPALFTNTNKISGPSVIAGPNFSFLDGSVLNSTTYCYIVTVTDPGGIESGQSNQAQAIIPAPSRLPPTGLTVTVN